ncbi:hypothetical protein GOP47_0005066 [Adiantum capillus-veneris]|uniref:Association with the SNF1 complex (ASC) domain-containing protein n=1 Tax=Adiantum capillus-veneris TaxID=13818 RepID=A0A9D4V628_ADICA|nr:hypothetical protein GOP47_0005066 [Adiantum capillus-veneris]
MGNVSTREGEEIAGSDAGSMRALSSSMMLESPVPAHAPPSDFSMSSTPPGTSPSLITPQMPQVPLCHADEAGLLWKHQVAGTSSKGGDALEGPTIAALISWNHGGNDVAVEGSWDNWCTRLTLQRSGKDFAILKFLAAGVYHYKFLVNGEWTYSPDLPFVLDESGNGVNILYVQDNVAENLDGIAEFAVPGSPESSYDSPFPGPEDYSKDPPLLPSQLYVNTQLESAQHRFSSGPSLQPSSMCSAARPQHVVLNHLFVETKKATSSPPVLALGFTQRFRAKYVTVILHKPLRR